MDGVKMKYIPTYNLQIEWEYFVMHMNNFDREVLLK